MMAVSVDARTVTTRRDLRLRSDVKERLYNPPSDTIYSPTDSIVVAGYDKMLRSTRETFFVTNSSSRHITTVAITLVYYDMQGRMLHSRAATIHCDIPPSETRQLYLSSWDSQQLFYYYLSPAPRRAATPYTVKHSIDYVEVMQR